MCLSGYAVVYQFAEGDSMKYLKGQFVTGVMCLICFAAGITVQNNAGAQEIKKLGHELYLDFDVVAYMQNQHLDDGGGLDFAINYKYDKYPLVFRLGFIPFATIAIPRILAAEDAVYSYVIEPAVLARIDVGQYLQPYVGIGYGSTWFSNTIEQDDSVHKIIARDYFSRDRKIIYNAGIDIITNPRVAVNLNIRYTNFKPTVSRKSTHYITHLVETSEDKLTIKSVFLSLGIRVHLMAGPRFRGVPSER